MKTTIYHVIEKRESVSEFETEREAVDYISRQHPDCAQYMRVEKEEVEA